MKDYSIFKVTRADGSFWLMGCHRARDVFYGMNDDAVLATVKIERIEAGLTEKQIIDHRAGMSYIPRKFYIEGGL